MKIAAYASNEGNETLLIEASKNAIQLADFEIEPTSTHGLAFEECNGITKKIEQDIILHSDTSLNFEAYSSKMSKLAQVILDNCFIQSIPLGLSFLSSEFEPESLLRILKTPNGMNIKDDTILRTSFTKDSLSKERKTQVVLNLVKVIESEFPSISEYLCFKAVGLIISKVGVIHSEDDYPSDRKTPFQKYLVNHVKQIVKSSYPHE